ncbi:unnamed protein product [Closterium sp. NIES-53]
MEAGVHATKAWQGGVTKAVVPKESLRTCVRSGVAGAGGSAAGGTGAGGAGGAGPGCARTSGTEAAGAGGVGGAGAGDPGAGGTGAGDPRAGGTGAGCARAGGNGARGVGASSSGGAGVTAGAGGTGGAGAAGPGGACTGGTGAAEAGGVGVAGAGDPRARGTRAGDPRSGGAGARDARAGDPGTGNAGAGGTRAGGAGAGGTGAGDPGAGDAGAGGARVGGTGAGGIVQRRPLFVLPQPWSLPPPDSVLRQVHSLPLTTACSFYLRRADRVSYRQHREPASCPASPVRAVCTARQIPRPHHPPVPSTHIMVVRPSSVPLRVPLPSPPTSSLLDVLDPESDLVHAASPTIPPLLATVVTDPSFESTTASALVAELVDFAAACRLDYATSLVAESQEEFECLASAVPHLVAMLFAPEGDPDAPDILTPRSYAEAIAGSLPVFKARYVAGGFSQRQGPAHGDLATPPTGSFLAGTLWSLRWPVYGLRQAPREWHDTLRTTLAALGFAPSAADPSLFLRTDTSLPPFYVLVYVDDLVFATAYTEALALVKSELQKRHTCTDLGELRSYLGLQITRDRARRTITLTESHMVHQVLQRFGFRYSSPESTPLPTDHSLSNPPSDESVELSGPYPKLVGCLMYLMTCTRRDLAYPLSILARYVAPGRHRPEHWEAAKRVLRYLCSTLSMGLVLGGWGPVVLSGHADVRIPTTRPLG